MHKDQARHVLVVPIRLDALVLDESTRCVGPSNDFTKLPTSARPGPYISENVVSQPFSESGTLEKGIHLHWTLPDALTMEHPELYKDYGPFPPAPNRWLVRRERKSDSSVMEWIVESDYVAAENSENGVSIPFDLRGDTGGGYAVLGRVIALQDQGPADPATKYLGRMGEPTRVLTAVGYGHPTFSALYSNCRNVFGMHDPEPTPNLKDLRYTVVGWYDDCKHDVLTLIRECVSNNRQATDGDILSDFFQWELVGNAQNADPARSFYVASIDFEPESENISQVTESTVEIAVGNTGTEALSAMLAHKIDADKASDADKATIEDQLESLLLASELQRSDLDLDARFEEARHNKGFIALPGGHLWAIEQDVSDSVSGAVSSELAMQLKALNDSQREYDAAIREIASRRRELFSDWYKFQIGKYPDPDQDPEQENVPQKIRTFMESSMELLNSLIVKTGTLQMNWKDEYEHEYIPELLNGDANSVAARIVDAFARFSNKLEAHGRKLKCIAAPRFWQPTEPVLLLTRPEVVATKGHAWSGRLQGKTGNNNRLPCQLYTASESSTSNIDVAKALTQWQVPDSVNIWKNNPWHPVLLQWKVEKSLRRERKYDENAILERYELDDNTCDLREKPPPRKARNAVSYRGQTVLSSYAGHLVASHLKDFLDSSNKDVADGPNSIFKHVKHALSELMTLSPLSQSLGGINQAFLVHKETTQLPIRDPAGSPEDLKFAARVAEAVEGQIRSAPWPRYHFDPIRVGEMTIKKLGIVDNFGLYRKLDWETVAVSRSLKRPKENNDVVILPPRIVQPARLDFRWTVGNEPQGGNPNPVVGWFIRNYLDNTLAIYGADGQALGSIDLKSKWQAAPGTTTRIDDIENRYLKERVQQLCDHGSSIFNDFVSAVDDALENIEPERTDHHDSLSLLAGRPLALVRADLNIELHGRPACMYDFRHNEWKDQRDDGKFTEVKFPVRLGEYRRLADGVVGYWMDGEPVFHSPRQGRGSEGEITDLVLHLSMAKPVFLSLLVDPTGDVHATSGIFPTKRLSIPAQFYAEALERLEIDFAAGPILQYRPLEAKESPQSLRLPLPAAPHDQSWSWLEQMQDGTVKLFICEDELDRRVELHERTTIREGWLALRHAPQEKDDKEQP